MPDPLRAGAVIGILGGGQLGRMLAMAAARLGYRAHAYDPAADCPAAQVCHRATAASYADTDALTAFAAAIDVATYEFENVPEAALDALEGKVPVRPGRRALAISQDRLSEKDFLTSIGIATAPYARIDTAGDLAAALIGIGAPSLLKTRRLGYDGKGQARIDRPGDTDRAFAAMAGQSAILEGYVDFTREISVIAARGLSGEIVAYDPGENLHEGGILRSTTVPARIPPEHQRAAVLAAEKILKALDYVGVIGVEFFVTAHGLLVNEFAPRVHNSGHWTQGGCAVDQFEQHIRAIAGWQLGDGSRYADVAMENLIGDDIAGLPQIAREAGAQIHLYGKAETRPGRKMGHVNRPVPRR